ARRIGRHDDIDRQADQLRCQSGQPISVSICGANLEDKILSLDVAKLSQSFAKFVAKSPRISACQHERADARQLSLLRPRRKRPSGRSAAERDELTPLHAEHQARPSRARCVEGRIPRDKRAVLTARYLARARRAPSRTVNAAACSPPRSWSLEAIKVGALMFRAHPIKHSVLCSAEMPCRSTSRAAVSLQTPSRACSLTRKIVRKPLPSSPEPKAT